MMSSKIKQCEGTSSEPKNKIMQQLEKYKKKSNDDIFTLNEQV